MAIQLPPPAQMAVDFVGSVFRTFFQLYGRALSCLLAFALFVAFLFIRLPNASAENSGMMEIVLGTTLAMAALWFTNAIPMAITAMIPIVVFPLTGVMSGGAIPGLYLNQVSMIFFGGFTFAIAMERWQLHRRIGIKTMLISGSSLPLLLLGVMCVTFGLSLFISNTAAALIMVPNVLAIIEHFEDTYNSDIIHPLSLSAFLGIAHMAAFGGVAVLTATPPNLIFTETVSILFPRAEHVTFLQWMLFGFPLAVGLSIFLYVLFLVVFVSRTTKRIKAVRYEREKLGFPTTDTKPTTTANDNGTNLPTISIEEVVVVAQPPASSQAQEEPQQAQEENDKKPTSPPPPPPSSSESKVQDEEPSKVVLDDTMLSPQIQDIMSANQPQLDNVFEEGSRPPSIDLDRSRPPSIDLERSSHLSLIRRRRRKKKEATGMSLLNEEYKKLGPISFEEIIIIVLFFVLGILWLGREDIGPIPGWARIFSNPKFINDGTTAIGLSILLFFIPALRAPPLPPQKITKQEQEKEQERQREKEREREQQVAITITDENNLSRRSLDSISESRLSLDSITPNDERQIMPIPKRRIQLPKIEPKKLALRFITSTHSLITNKSKHCLMDWDAMKKFPWDILLLFGGGFVLAEAFRTSGLTSYFGNLLSVLQSVPTIFLIAISALATMILSLIVSNTSTCQMMLPVMASLSIGARIHPFLTMIPTALAASTSFILPISTPPNMIVFATGRVKIIEMASIGVVLNAVSLVAITLFTYFVIPFVFGFNVNEFPEWAENT